MTQPAIDLSAALAHEVQCLTTDNLPAIKTLPQLEGLSRFDIVGVAPGIDFHGKSVVFLFMQSYYRTDMADNQKTVSIPTADFLKVCPRDTEKAPSKSRLLAFATMQDELSAYIASKEEALVQMFAGEYGVSDTCAISNFLIDVNEDGDVAVLIDFMVSPDDGPEFVGVLTITYDQLISL